MLDYVRVPELEDPEKPWKTVWRTPTGVLVKVHADRREVDFGTLQWVLTGSACGEDGKVLMENGRPAIHYAGHEFTVQSDERARPRKDSQGQEVALLSLDEIVERMRIDFEREQRFVVSRIEEAVRKRQAALLLGGSKAAPA